MTVEALMAEIDSLIDKSHDMADNPSPVLVKEFFSQYDRVLGLITEVLDGIHK